MHACLHFTSLLQVEWAESQQRGLEQGHGQRRAQQAQQAQLQRLLAEAQQGQQQRDALERGWEQVVQEQQQHHQRSLESMQQRHAEWGKGAEARERELRVEWEGEWGAREEALVEWWREKVSSAVSEAVERERRQWEWDVKERQTAHSKEVLLRESGLQVYR